MSECTGAFFINDGQVTETRYFDLGYISRQHCIYEVMRIIDGKPLFFREHVERFIRSSVLENLGIFPGENEIRDAVRKLMDANQQFLGNIKILFFPSDRKAGSLVTYWNPHWYPAEVNYSEGMDVMFFRGIRKNPNSKRLNLEFREEVNRFIRKNELYEVILTDEEGYITEGGRSNVFFIKGGQIFTTPVDRVLPGITRDKIFDLCKSSGINIIESRIHASEAGGFDSLFITSTSSKVLPVRSLEDLNFNVNNEVLRKLMTEYNRLTERDILGFRWDIS